MGMLFESDGNDQYSSIGMHSQGAGFDSAFGALIDKQGNDSYSGIEYCQGETAHSSFGLLLDMAGKDAYKAKSLSQAEIGPQGEHWEEDWPAIALLLDIGEDRNAFSGGDRKDGVSEKSDFSLFITLKLTFEKALAGSMKIE